jgi:hypothetical protein
MKTLKTILCICLLALFSCETEEVNLQEEELTTANLTTQQANNDPWQDWNSDEFGAYLQLIAERIAHTISYDPLAAAEFNTIAQNNTSFGNIPNTSAVIPLEAIFSDNTSHLYEAIENVSSWCDIVPVMPGSSSGQPYPPLGNNISLTYQVYIDNILNDHCLELYLPFGFTPSITITGETNTIATSHPLNNIDTEYSAVQFPAPQIGCGDITINESSTYENLLIIRPNPGFSVTPDNYCAYPIYSDIDFTEFFEQ